MKLLIAVMLGLLVLFSSFSVVDTPIDHDRGSNSWTSGVLLSLGSGSSSSESGWIFLVAGCAAASLEF